VKAVLFGSFVPGSQPGGITTHCTRLAERLEETPSCAVRRVNIKLRGPLRRSFLRGNPAAWLCAAMRARLSGFHLFHFNASSRSLPFLILAPLLRPLGARLILSFHSGALSASLGRNDPLAIALFRVSLALAHRVIFMNQRESAAVALRFPRHAAKFAAIGPFVLPALKDREKALCRKDLQGRDPGAAPRDRPYVVACMGAWLPYYLFEEVITVLQRVSKDFPSSRFELRIAAALFNIDPAYKRKIEAAARLCRPAAGEGGLRVTTEENVADPLVFLADCDLLVRSSSVDSFGLCVAEALFLGKPAIATDVCRRAEGALLYTPHDLDALEAHIRLSYQRHRDGTQPPLSLPEAEDDFPRLLRLYGEEAAA
jgi:glycosyltransferase involved in cell wall biosynthesis